MTYFRRLFHNNVSVVIADKLTQVKPDVTPVVSDSVTNGRASLQRVSTI